MLFDSLRNKIMPLADDVIVYPAHGAGSACGKNLSKETVGVLESRKQTNYALTCRYDKRRICKRSIRWHSTTSAIFCEKCHDE